MARPSALREAEESLLELCDDPLIQDMDLGLWFVEHAYLFPSSVIKEMKEALTQGNRRLMKRLLSKHIERRENDDLLSRLDLIFADENYLQHRKLLIDTGKSHL